MAIEVKFGGDELPNVVGVQLGSDLAKAAIVSQGSLVGFRTRRIVARGFVKRQPTKESMLAAQLALEDQFAAKGPANIEYPGITTYQARLLTWDWEEWTNGPIVRYSATFEAEATNPFSENVTIVQQIVGGSKNLVPRPSVSDSFRNPSELDERIDPTKDKRIAVQGVIRGSASEVDAEETTIKNLLTGDEFFSVTIPSGVYSCKVADFEFGTPAGTDENATKTYKINLLTLPDFALEARALTGGPISIAGVTLDVAGSFSRSIQRDQAGAITSESVNVSGRKFGASITEVENFKGAVDALVVAGANFASPTGKILAATSANWSEPKRDGFASDGTKRYSIQVSMSFSIDPAATAGAAGGTISGIVLGVNFSVIDSITYGASFGDNGSVSSRTKSASGKVVAVPTIRAGDNVVEGEDGRTYYLTSLSLGAVDDSGRRSVSVSGQTIDTAAAVEQILPFLFEGFFLDHVRSRTKGVSYQLDECDNIYKATSINQSVSGYKVGTDGGVLDLIQAVNRFPDTFIITNVSTGGPELKKNAQGTTELRYPISISGTQFLSTVIGACREEKSIKEEVAREIEDSTAKLTPINIPGKGVVMKKIGVNPAVENVTVRKVAKNPGVFESMPFPSDPSPSIKNARNVGRSTSETGLTKSVKIKFQSFDGVIAE